MYGDRLPPHDLDAEEAVLGSLLIDGNSIYKIAGLVQKDDFYHEQARLIYGACLALYQRNEAINQITVAQELDRLGKLEACGGAAYLSHLVAIVPTSLDIEHYAQIVYRLAVSRNLIEAARQIETIGYEAHPDVDQTLNRAEDVLFKMRHGQSTRDFVHIRQVLDKYFEIAPPDTEGTLSRLPQVMTRFTGLDELLGGLQRSDLVVVAGRPSMGKTSLAMNIARNASVELKATVAVFSLEMSRESLVLRLLSSEASVDLKHVRMGLHRDIEDEEKRIMEATGILSEAEIYIDDSPNLRVVEMRGKARRLFYERGVDLVIIDHLGLMQGEGRTDNRVQEISYISRSLKALARDLNVPIIAVSQLSRASEWRTSHRPQLSDLRDSGSIEQDADVVVFIYRDDYYYKKEEWDTLFPDREYPVGIAEVIVAKHRNGPTGQVNLHFEPRFARFENMANQEASLI